jgi:hypothetical protein
LLIAALANMDFAPTALLVMTHNVTGLKYFCKTTRLGFLHKYKGSGVYWKRHMRLHGRDVTVGVLGVYFDKDRCMSAALNFSKENDIVKDSGWANCILENGLDGAGAGEANHRYGKPHPNKGGTRPEMIGRLIGPLNGMYGKPSPLRGVPKPKGKDSPLYGRKRPDGCGKPSKAVVRLDDGVVFESVSDAGRACNGATSGISKCCMGKAKSAHGFRWAYKENV